VLPPEYLREMRAIIVGGRQFRDWTWCHAALGSAPGEAGRPGPDWFRVCESQVSQEDPDCVTRTRIPRRPGSPILEMWSPVRWVAQLVTYSLPARASQIRTLDSGEADTWRFESSESGQVSWVRNRGLLARGTERNPWAQGVFRRSKATGSGGAAMRLNVHKTAEPMMRRRFVGYEIPWEPDQLGQAEIRYWLKKLRNWQERYNPVSRLTSWAELDTRHTHVKSKAELASRSEACFLFRLLENREGERHLPLGDSALDHTHYAVLKQLEQRLGANGARHADGSHIRLVTDMPPRTSFPAHCVRASFAVIDLNRPSLALSELRKALGHTHQHTADYAGRRGDKNGDGR
jgi:hypothetical protein